MPNEADPIISGKRRDLMISTLDLSVDASDSEIVAAFVGNEKKYRAAMLGMLFSETIAKALDAASPTSFVLRFDVPPNERKRP